jgi:hypothetical protein
MVEAPARLLIAPDGSLLARVVGDHVDLINGTTLVADSEVGIDPTATDSDVALGGAPLRLVVVARHDGITRVHAVDPRGPTATGELTVRATMRVAAAAGDHLWLTGPSGSAVLDVVRKELVMWPLPLRTPVHGAGSFAGTRFVVSTAGMLEEWDPITRAPVRRFRLGKPAPARWVGGGARQVWMVAANEPDRIDVIPLVNHGQPPRIDLPEPIASVAGEPSGEQLVVVGDSGTAWIVDLSGRTPVMPLEGLVVDAAGWFGGLANVAVALRGGGVQIVPVAGRLPEGQPPPMRSRPVAAPAAASRAAVPPIAVSDPNVADRLTAWRERMRAATPHADASGPTFVAPPSPPGWRDHVAAWARALASGTASDPPALEPGLLTAVATRFALTDELADALTLLYGAHLCGQDGVAVVELAAIVHRRWDEALGRGVLAGRGVARWRRGRARLARPVADVLDEVAPRLGTLIASDAVLPTGPLAVLCEDDDVELADLAAALAPQLGPLFVPTPRGRAKPTAFMVEARARGAAPIVAWRIARADLPPTAVVLVPDDAAARDLRAPVIERWPLR